ncbi:uncharacterized protein LODBEIA_P41700 [Lodderomyces beijingensis]|uniref:Arrestin C-terminal-like domain-containing protein n=1 Tax=Lodderomyces beijingensis TaxID=1775926 RepID=A0ABP0ZSM4_9ASCO
MHQLHSHQHSNSPLFPPSQLTNQDHNTAHNPNIFIPTLPEKPTASTQSIAAYIVPSEQNLFVQGFDQQEYSSRPPTILRGALFIRILKPTKIKAINLSFKGVQRTEWPEGIPPKKNQFHESNDIITHTWPFFQAANGAAAILPNNGADLFIEKNGTPHQQDLEELSAVRSNSPAPSGHIRQRNSSNSLSVHDNFFSRNLSPNFMRRAKSPSIGSVDASTLSDLTSSISPGVNDPNVNMAFVPGDYLYNFEHPLPPSIPESCKVTFGSTEYHLEVSIQRPGTFKSNLSGRLPINIIRTPSESNLEENESIVITRDWEDQIRYDLVIGAKSVVLNSYLPLAFRFVPLWGKVALHRIRIYLTENLEYYCNNKSVHRMEPSKKYLLLEHKARKGRSLLQKNPHDQSDIGLDQYEDDVLPKELEFQLYVPRDVSGKPGAQIHPDTSYENIQAHHWIKICLRISKTDPENPAKRKHYEISIDSPLHILSPLAAHGNTMLPAYDDLVPPVAPPNSTTTPPDFSNHPLSPEVIPVDHVLNGTGTSSSSASSASAVVRSMFNNSARSRRSSSVGLDSALTGDVGSPARSIEFQHINSTLDLEGVERDADMHLEANLYKPDDEEIITAINSPQAKPHSGTFSSPLNSPVQRPIHLIRQPSTAPPPFVEGDRPLHPPTYQERDEGSLSLSPLRIDEVSEQSFANPLHAGGEDGIERGLNITTETGGSVTPVRDLLFSQLNGSTRRASVNNSQQQQQQHTDSTTPAINGRSGSSVVPEISIFKADEASEVKRSSIAPPKNEVNEDEAVQDEEDLADDPISPISPRLPPVHHARKWSRTRHELSPSPTRISLQDNINGNHQHQQTPASISPLQSSFQSKHQVNGGRSSRSSSVSSVTSDTAPIEQTMPLLNLSNSSILTFQQQSQQLPQSFYEDEERNHSIASSIYDLALRRPSQVGPHGLKPAKFLNNDDEFHKSASLKNLRNPRLRTHYQDTLVDDDDDGDNDEEEEEEEEEEEYEEEEGKEIEGDLATLPVSSTSAAKPRSPSPGLTSYDAITAGGADTAGDDSNEEHSSVNSNEVSQHHYYYDNRGRGVEGGRSMDKTNESRERRGVGGGGAVGAGGGGGAGTGAGGGAATGGVPANIPGFKIGYVID